MFYDFSFAFWSHFSTEHADLPSGRALAHTSVPYLLSNAAWYPVVGELRSVTEWYAERDLPPALIVPGVKPPALARALEEGPFNLEQGFSSRPAEASPETFSSVVEQVDWRQSRYAGALLANRYEQPDLAFPIAKSLTTAIQVEPRISLFLTYHEDTPVGMMATFESDSILCAMLVVDENGNLEHRLTTEAQSRGLEAFVLEALPAGVTLGSGRGLERWSIR